MPLKAYRSRYEQLRKHVLAGQDGSRAWGLNLLQTRGVAAWVKAVCPEQASDSPTMPTLCPVRQLPVADTVSLPDSVQRQLATVLAEMILRRQPELAGSFQ